ncbi:MAG TPA: ABC transporter permease subunit [Mesorhizobium sp.]|jgi:general L-amino acid transport system permease protein|uniref:amino acid ABC transporter permease n=1 Tax=Mesorhizobium sp. TaxID=1871066 RepID=UPI002DDD58E5|nr:ABC transporter permease subunit [Mesorhizobium sp.]HEV2507249.1 ABC transporter permease subunit [Mesorhizobium sp.]
MATTEIVPGRDQPGLLSRLVGWWGPRPFIQLAVFVAVVALFWLLGANVADTMRRIGVTPGFGFLERSANFEIGESVIAFKAGDLYIWAILAGLINTIKVAALGCVLATVLGVALGVAGLSGNLLLATLVRWYVELIRNTPLLLQLFFWIALAKSFPPPRQALSAFDALFLSNRGVFVPGIVVDGFSSRTLLLLVAIVLSYGLYLYTTYRRRRLRFGNGAIASLVLLAAAGAAFPATGATLVLDMPVLGGFNIRGGYSLTPEFAALLAGLTVKFSAAIAEIVRAGIQSVSRGQWEAARALGLHPGQIMRLVVLPQALRVITPLITSSYLDLTKDSSLAVAIGYPDLVSIINTTANTTGQSFEALAILIGIYLALNLSVSALMNVYNRRVALRGDVSR